MRNTRRPKAGTGAVAVAVAITLLASGAAAQTAATAGYPIGYGPTPVLPAPDTAHRESRFARVTGWAPGEAPRAPAGFQVQVYAAGLDHPRWLYVLPNGDVLAAESNNPGTRPPRTREDSAARRARVGAGLMGNSANRITLLRDTTGDGLPDVRSTFLSGLNRPFGMALVGTDFYVGNTDGVLRFRYEPGALRISGAGVKVLDLPAGGYNNHWTRNLLASRDGRRLYVTVGSATNVDVEGIDAKDPRRAAVLELDLATGRWRVFATGLRNPNGLAWEPVTGALWTAVNERDRLGADLVPDYITQVRDGGFYGWPYAYYGQHVDPRHPGAPADLVRRAVAPDYATGAHTATLDIRFYTGTRFGTRYRSGAFVSQRGSWNRAEFAGYRVLFVPFAGGRPSGPPEVFLDGWAAGPGDTVKGRPTGLAVLPDGSLLVTDDAADRIWRVTRTDSPETSAVRIGVVSAGVARPEGVLYDAPGQHWFVSNINGASAVKDGNGFITRLGREGAVDSLRFIAGGRNGATLHAPKGMTITGDTLWVADIDAIRAFDRRTGVPLLSVDVPQALFLNDVAVGPDGALYVTDTGVRPDAAGNLVHIGPDRIYRIARGRASVALEGDSVLFQPNGILYDARARRFVLAPVAGRSVLSWRPGAPPTVLAAGPGRYDGIELLDDRILVSVWRDSTVSEVRGDTLVPVIRGVPSAADIGLDAERRRVGVPLIADDRVELWELPAERQRGPAGGPAGG